MTQKHYSFCYFSYLSLINARKKDKIIAYKRDILQQFLVHFWK